MACPEFDRACESAKNGGLNKAQKAKIKKKLQEHAEEIARDIMEMANKPQTDSFLKLFSKEEK